MIIVIVMLLALRSLNSSEFFWNNLKEINTLLIKNKKQKLFSFLKGKSNDKCFFLIMALKFVHLKPYKLIDPGNQEINNSTQNFNEELD